MIIQIYAFTDPETAVAAIELGVDNIGFIAGKYDLVFGELSFDEAKEIVQAIPTGATSTAITMSDQVDEILRMANAIKPNIVHISSDVNLVDIEDMRKLRNCLSPEIQLMKAIPVGGEESIALARQYALVSDLLLLDTSKEGFPGVGATGFIHNWSISRQIIESVHIPVILAGGLSSENVVEAIQAVKPWGVDSNTSTNVPGSRVEKDLGRIAAFVSAIKNSESADEGGVQKA
ncbi:MAG: phosphoribosylanthranilate isomerase [Pelolinea sp.]|nr:phosphoribosylanthranilate isomerase [Pelolinea sp.]